MSTNTNKNKYQEDRSNTKRSTSKRNRNTKSNYSRTTKRCDNITEDANDGKKYGDRSNDPAWYAKNPQLLKDAASLAFSNRSGAYLDFGIPDRLGYGGANPGIMSLHWEPSLGECWDGSTSGIRFAGSPVNMAALNIYSYVRHANSGSANYDAPDLMMAILAADSVFSSIAHLIRAYGIARVYDQKNIYYPTALLKAMGFDPTSVMNNLANFRYRINNIIAKASVIWVPSNMSLVTRHFWMNSNIYKDADSPKAQNYMFVQDKAWKFSPATEQTGSSLVTVDLGGRGASNQSYDEVCDTVEKLLDPIISDEDMGIMFGDMLKAYGKENLYSINMIDENYTVLPVFNKEVLMQIHNLNTLPQELGNVKQTPDGYIYEDAAYTSSSQTREAILPPYRMFDYMDMIPEPENIMVSSRLMGRTGRLFTYYSTGDQWKSSFTCGSERIARMNVWYYNKSGELKHYGFTSHIQSSDITEEELIELVERFDWAPLLYLIDTTLNTTAPFSESSTFDLIVGDIDNYTLVDNNVLSKMDTTALLSEFDVPLML